MTDFFHRFIPHGHCFFWQTDILIGFVAGDILTFIAYMVIPTVILMAHKGTYSGMEKLFPITRLFSLFIYLCGFGHLIDAFNVFLGLYKFQAYWNMLTAIVSIYTSIEVFRIIKHLEK